jgi:hypothetical protein
MHIFLTSTQIFLMPNMTHSEKKKKLLPIYIGPDQLILVLQMQLSLRRHILGH